MVCRCKDYEHHISPHWYNIVHFEPKSSWICFFGLYPKRLHTNGDIVYTYKYMIIPTSSQCGTLFVTQQSSPRTNDHWATPQMIIHMSTLYQPGLSCPLCFCTRLTWTTTCLESLLYQDQLLFTMLRLGPVHEESGAHCLSNIAHPQIPSWSNLGPPPSFSILRIHPHG